MEIKTRWIISIAIIIGVIIGRYTLWVVGFFMEGAPPNIPLDMALYILLPFFVLTGLFMIFVNNKKITKKRILDNVLFIVFQIIGFVLFFISMSIIDNL
ncbi:hypothetical protein CMI43_00785 [Candidatus Pacearchaeota archaeon]|nr:hypothetical protein [Candidatus Pacearchaeota archaeon]|tara:strand:- start:87 stop:383 length:297 start_codon:yes stop_codon:yes gene_type:complete